MANENAWTPSRRDPFDPPQNRIIRNRFRQEEDETLDYRPMLLVCYTNHALDQFLEGISKFLDKGLLRIGGRCQNTAIEKYANLFWD
jgi:hypothetical protein